MKTGLQRHHTRTGTGQTASRVFAVVLCFVVVIASAWFVNPSIFQAMTRTRAPASAPAGASMKADRYIGLIQLAPNQQGRCEQFELDNRTAILRPKGAGTCLDDAAPVATSNADRSATHSNAPPPGEPSGRIKGIGDYFKAR